MEGVQNYDEEPGGRSVKANIAYRVVLVFHPQLFEFKEHQQATVGRQKWPRLWPGWWGSVLASLEQSSSDKLICLGWFQEFLPLDIAPEYSMKTYQVKVHASLSVDTYTGPPSDARLSGQSTGTLGVRFAKSHVDGTRYS